MSLRPAFRNLIGQLFISFSPNKISSSCRCIMPQDKRLKRPGRQVDIGRRMNHRQRGAFKNVLMLAAVMVALVIAGGCTAGFLAQSSFREASDLFSQGKCKASLRKYEEIIKQYPAVGDRALYEMGIIYAQPANRERDYDKSLACFQKVVKDYPQSIYKQDSDLMILHLTNVTLKDKVIESQRSHIDSLSLEIKSKASEIAAERKTMEQLEQELKLKEAAIDAQQQKIEALERELKTRMFIEEHGKANRVLIEKKERRLTLFSNDKIIKIYRIALGGSPSGPKERQGDKKTPEGIYYIDSRNMNSRYHIALHISYPNEKDKLRAKKEGVSPGGNIMIHGIKSGFGWVRDLHTEVDWTEGCIAVTNQEIEEIEKLVPNGTVVEIRP